jgi:cell division protein YceG involved in septum cleavage
MPIFTQLRSPLAVATAFLTGAFCIGILSFVTIALLEEKRVVTYAVPEDPKSTEFEHFPLSVNPLTKTITEDPLIDWYVRQHLSIDTERFRQRRLIDKIFSELAQLDMYQQFASPLTRTLVIYPGERREEVVTNFGDILDWNAEERAEFASLVANELPVLSEGKFYPGKYVVAKISEPETIAALLNEKFTTEVLNRYDETIESVVPLEQALIIASLLEREAYDFNDMRYISGVIWNRLFIGMPLQLDATLQYARGSKPSEPKWWPVPKPADKYIESPYNTYQEAGLPPTAIANPSLEAIVAALNPRQTDCFFYFHDQDGNFYCTPTYEEHVVKLREIYGQGR